MKGSILPALNGIIHLQKERCKIETEVVKKTFYKWNK